MRPDKMLCFPRTLGLHHCCAHTALIIATLWVSAALGQPSLFGSAHELTRSANNAESVHAVDLDGDGDMDVLSASYGDDKIAWYENDGARPPMFSSRTITADPDGPWGAEGFANGPHSVSAADMDGDGDMDVLSASYQDISVDSPNAPGPWTRDDKIAWYENDGSTPPVFAPHTLSTTTIGPCSVFAVDLDADGDADVVSASPFDGKVVWYENDGAKPPAFTTRIVTASAGFVQGVFGADLDGDGDVDLLSASSNQDKIAWYENDGAKPPAFTARTVATDAIGAFSVFAADVDGDGDTDVLSASAYDGKIAWYENNGASPPSFAAHTITTSALGTCSVFAADINGDGHTDVLSASRRDDTIAWYESDGRSQPSFLARTITTSARGARSVHAADLDKDGDLDVLCASRSDNTISWYENRPVPPATPTPSATGEPTEPPTPTPTPPQEPVHALITSFYEIPLARDPEPGAVDAWQHGYFDYAVGFDIDVRFVPREMARIFFLCDEYAARQRTNAEFLGDCYQVFLSRAPSQTELDNWLGGAWNRSEVMTIFAESQEFADRIAAMYPSRVGNRTRNLVTFMYAGLLDRLVDQSGLEYASGLFDAAFASGGIAAVRAQAKQMAREVIVSDEFLDQNPTTNVYVTRFYRAFLGRFPNDAELAFWTAELDSGRRTTDNAIDLFADSAEFTERLRMCFETP